MTTTFENPGSPTRNPDDGVKRDRFGRYLLPECEIGPAPKKEVPFTRATTFAKSISDTYALSAWSQRMVAKGVATRQDLRLRAATLDVRNDKDEMNEVCEAAKEAASAKSAARLGSAMHSFTEQADRGEPVDAQEYAPNLAAYSATLSEFGIKIMPNMIERIVVWKRFSIAGTFDRIAMHNGQPVILDLKTGRDLQYGWNEIAIQLCIYAHADGIWNPATWSWEAMPAVSRKRALVVHLPVADQTGEDPACTVYEVDLEPALAACQLCYDVREWRRMRNIAVPMDAPAPGMPSQDWVERINATSSVGELMKLWDTIPLAERFPVKPGFVRRAALLRELAG